MTTATTNTITLKPRQLEFIQWMDEHYPATVDADTTFTRGELRILAIKNGVKWAPAWIVKDTSRQFGRGEYRVPELAEYRGNAATASVTTDEEADARAADILSPADFNKAMDEHEAMEREMNAV